MAGGGGVTSREQTLSLLSAVKNHGDLAFKLSSLRQAKDILLSVEPSSLVGELFPYIVELQGSNKVLVRKILLELMEELGLKVMDQSSVFMPVFLALLKDGASSVVRQSIVSGTNFYCAVLKEMALQYHQSGKVERWLEELWSWMVKFKNAICGVALEVGPISTKLLAIKFLEMNVLLFTSDANDDETSSNEVKGQNLNITWVVGGQPMLDPDFLTLEANSSLGYLLDMLRSAKTLPGCVTITVISCLAAIARKRPMHYTRILSALLGFDPNFETPRSHAASIKYSLRIAYLGFLKCTHPCIVESRDILVKAADQVREVDKIVKNTERASRVVRFNKEDQKSNPFLPVAGGLNKKRSMLQDVDSKGNNEELPPKRTRYLPVGNAQSYPGHDEFLLMQNELTPVEQIIAALLAEGERGAKSLEILISKIHPDLIADIVIANMRHLPKNSPPFSSRFDASMSVNSPVSVQLSPKVDPSAEVYNSTSDVPPSVVIMDLEPVLSMEQSDFAVVEPELHDSNMIGLDQNSPVIPGTSAPDETFRELPPVPSYIELTGEEQNHLSELAVGRLIESSRQIHTTGCSRTCMELLARLVLQAAADQDIVSMVQKHIISDYEDQQAESLGHTLPTSEKSFSRFLGEAPLLPDSALKLLKDLCCSEGVDKEDVCDGDFTQDLGADGAFNYRFHGTTIIVNHTSSFVDIVVDGRASVEICDVNDKPVVRKGMETEKTIVLWDRVAVVGAGDGGLINEIIDEIKKVPADEGWDAEDTAHYGRFLLEGNYLENVGVETDANLFFASYLNEPQLYFTSKEFPVAKIVNDCFSIGCGSKYAGRYLRSKLGYQGQHESLDDRVSGYLSAMGCACTNNFGTGDRIRVHHITKHNDIPGDNGINLVRDVHEHDIEKEINEDILIDILEMEAERTWMEMKAQRSGGASANSSIN